MKIIGVMGPGEGATLQDKENAFAIGQYAAERGFAVLTGGRNTGVMHAALEGAQSVDGLTIGILPEDNKSGMSPAVTVPIVTGMGSARNNINVLTSDVVVACGIGSGTASEVFLALKAKKHVICLGDWRFLKSNTSLESLEKLHFADSLEDVFRVLDQLAR